MSALNLPFVKVTRRKCLEHSLNEDIRYLHNVTSEKSNIQYDSFHSAKQALKKIRDDKKSKIETLQVQGSVVTELWKTALPKAKNYWFQTQNRLPRNIFCFTVRYMNNSLACLSNPSAMGHKHKPQLYFLSRNSNDKAYRGWMYTVLGSLYMET